MTVAAIPANHSGTRLRAERERAEMSLRDLAYFARVSHPTVQRIENGTLDPSPALKARLARILRVPLNDLWPLDPEDSDAPAVQTEAAQEAGDDDAHLEG